MTMKLASSPCRNSSITTSRPASPRAARPASPSAAAMASAAVCAITTPLPAARPLALTTIGVRCRRTTRGSKLSRGDRDRGRSWNPVAAQEFLGEGLGALEARGRLPRAEAAQAVALEGIDDARDQRRFRPDDGERRRLRARHARSGAPMSVACTATLRTFGSRAVPALPGATNTSVTRVDAAHFQASACSRPPAPTIENFHAPQWRKWRMPVSTMAMPCSSAAAMTSASRFEPPGWITARTPYPAATSMLSRNGE